MIGHNGSGKSSLLHIINDSLHYSKGVFKKREGLHYQISLLSFDSHVQLLQQSIKDAEAKAFMNSLEELQVNHILKIESIHELIQNFGIADLLIKPLATLSNGETRKVLLVKTLLEKPKLLLLDEPFDGLDSQSSQDLHQTLEKVSQQTTCIIVSHRFEEIPNFVNSCFMHERRTNL